LMGTASGGSAPHHHDWHAGPFASLLPGKTTVFVTFMPLAVSGATSSSMPIIAAGAGPLPLAAAESGVSSVDWSPCMVYYVYYVY
jgi:hypothetical protein